MEAKKIKPSKRAKPKGYRPFIRRRGQASILKLKSNVIESLDQFTNFLEQKNFEPGYGTDSPL